MATAPTFPPLRHAELIDGIVSIPSPEGPGPDGGPAMPSPGSRVRHPHPQLKLLHGLGLSRGETPGTEGGDGGSIRLDLDHMPPLARSRGGPAGAMNRRGERP